MKRTLLCTTLLVSCCAVALWEPEAERVAVEVDEKAGHSALSVDGKTAFVYRFGPTAELPYFDPFNSATGRLMTLKITDPYPHHRSFCVADERVHLEGGRLLNLPLLGRDRQKEIKVTRGPLPAPGRPRGILPPGAEGKL